MNNKEKLNSSGFFLANKPQDITSSDLVQKIKCLTKVSKIGHTGTLDRFASGLLILPYGKYTSLANHFLSADKTYIAKATLGKFTDSGDKEGKILKEISNTEAKIWMKQNEKLTQEELKNLEQVTEQIPPKISALKIKGKRQADLYRLNVEFESKPRAIRIYSVQILEIQDISFSFKLKVSSGTYIRKIILDLSEKLKIPMYLEELTRTQVGSTTLEMANSLEDFQNFKFKSFSPQEIMNLPTICIEENLEKQVLNGKKVFISNPPHEFFLVNSKQEILAWCKGEDADYKFLKVFPK